MDVGPASTAPALVDALRRLDIKRLDWILLTHIHLDHAGAVGRVARRFPESRVACHASAIDHLAAPERLWEGTLKTLGRLAEAYGPPEALSRARLVEAAGLDLPGVRAVLTPGHAAHHVSYLMGKTLFAGEASGVILPGGSPLPYIRPATPPKLFLETFLESLDRLMGLNPESLCCGHFGIHPEAVSLMRAHRDQLLLWRRCILETLDRTRGEDPATACLEALLEADPRIRGLFRMDGATRERERFFMKNSVRGFLEALGREKRP